MTAAPDRYAVLGNPVAHSRSPFIHAEFARQTGQRIDYTRVLCAMDGFAQAVRDFAGAGARGCNVTVPFKFEAPALAQRVTPRAALAQAANVLRFDADGWLADNTDGVGLVRDLQGDAGITLQGSRVLLIGAGGAAAGVLGPLLEARPAQLQVVNRTPHKAAAPVSERVLRRGTLAVDLMYGVAAQPFMAWAAAHDALPRDGLGMLVEQAAEAFHLWRGVRPVTAPVLQRLRRQLDAQ